MLFLIFRWEEDLYYPLFEPKFSTAFIVAEHEAFNADLEAFEDYLISCLPTGAKYGYGKRAAAHEQREFNGAHMCSLVDAFAGPLAIHVSESPNPTDLMLKAPTISLQLMREITYIEPEKIKASGLTKYEVKRIVIVSKKHTMSMVRYLTGSVGPCDVRTAMGLMHGTQPASTFLTHVVLLTP